MKLNYRFVCAKCQAKTTTGGSKRWRGLRICAECAGRPRPDGPSSGATFVHGQSLSTGGFRNLPIRPGLLAACTEPLPVVKAKQPLIPTLSGRVNHKHNPELIAKVRGDVELRGMTKAEAARANGIKYESCCNICAYINSPHIDPK